MNIYIKPSKKVKITNKKIVYLKDIAEIYSSSGIGEKMKFLPIFNIESDNHKTYLISVVDIIKKITLALEEKDVLINNLGEMDILVEYIPDHKKHTKLVEYIKVAFISVTLLFGSATAIMSYHSDADMPQIMRGFYSTLFGEENYNPLILEIPYSIGLGVGIIIFFNHFSKIKVSNDPTPLEVQMTKYDNEVFSCIVDNMSKENNVGDN